MRHIHFPVWLGGLSRAGGSSFVALFMLDTLSRATLVTVLPLQALDLLGDAQKVSLLYFAVSAAALAGSLAVPALMRRLGRKWTTVFGALCLVGAAPLFASDTLWGMVTGLTLWFLGASALAICLNLYVLEHVPRTGLTRFEPQRVLFSAAGWVVGPALGVYLGLYVAAWAPYAASAGFAFVLILYFLALRVTGQSGSEHAASSNPLRFVRRFFAQPRLFLAWVLVAGRESWWGMFFIYAPIYAVMSGLGEETSGLIVSAGTASMFAVTLWSRVGRRHGIRRLLVGAYAATGAMTVAAGFAGGVPWLGAAFLVAAAIGAGAVESAGSVAFLRAVRPRERAGMTTVYTTYRDTARVATPALYSLVLQVFALPAVFVTGGLIALTLAGLARHIPRSLGRERRKETAAT